MKTFTPSGFFIKNVLIFIMTFSIVWHHDKAQPAAAIIWNVYYDAKKLLQADKCNIITSN